MTDRNIFDLTGRTALVTGGSRGLGKAMAEAVAAFGANVVIAARAKDKIDETLEVLNKYGVKTLGVVADMSKESDIKNMVDKTVEKFGAIDILFNNAGTARKFYKIHEDNLDGFDAVIATNLRGPFVVLQHVLPVMMKQGKGSIIFTSSTAGLRAEYPEIASVAYSSAKAGINIMTQIAALEYAEYGIRVNCIAPGIHESELGRDLNANEKADAAAAPPDPAVIEAMQTMMQKTIEDIPMRRGGKADELAGLAVLLASDASSYITGQVFTQDGGRSIKH